MRTKFDIYAFINIKFLERKKKLIQYGSLLCGMDQVIVRKLSIIYTTPQQRFVRLSYSVLGYN